MNIDLSNGEIVKIPELAPELIETVFMAHASFAEQGVEPMPMRPMAQPLFGNEDMAFRFGFAGLDGIGTALQHNPSQMNAPDMPKEVLEKIASIAKVIAPSDPNMLPKAEPHCNCMHCQISRAIHHELEQMAHEEELLEVEIKDEELTFSQWDIKTTGENLYTVSNRLDMHEKYSVYLGHPVGCTCGIEGCEHILAVLRN